MDNPAGTRDFAFVEFCGDAELHHDNFTKMGFEKINQGDIVLYKQNEINFIVNTTPDSHAHNFSKIHHSSVSAMGFRVDNPQKALEYTVSKGAKAVLDKEIKTFDVPAIYGIGESIIYFIDKLDFIDTESTGSAGLTYIDHLTHNVYQGNMDHWADFYINCFNFREIRYFDIKGEQTGLLSRAMTSPCGNIKIPINEATDEQSQIAEYLREYNGEGIQHIALGTDDIYDSVQIIKNNKINFMDVPDTYFEMIKNRVSWHDENVENLQKLKILLDGTKTPEGGLLLQIFTNNLIGPVFFEIIQRKGNQGFGEGNFQALFESIERDQIRRGVLKPKDEQ